MRLHSCLIYLLVASAGCGLRKKQNEQTSLSQSHLATSVHNEKLKANQNLVLVDSSYSGLMLQIKPKGNFQYSPKDGFIGEADVLSLFINNSLVKKAHLNNDLNLTKKTQKQEKTVVKSQQSTKRSVAFGSHWWWLLAFPLLIFLFRYRKILIFFFVPNNKLHN